MNRRALLAGISLLAVGKAHASLLETRGAASAIGFGFASNHALVKKTIVLHPADTSWTVPADWNSANNTVEGIGAGAAGDTAGGGGGGAYSKSTNLTFTPGGSVSVTVPSTPADGNALLKVGASVVWSAASASGLTGGASASCVSNSLAYSGGNGGSSTAGSAVNSGGGGGGGAAGPNGGGAAGAAGVFGTNGGAGGTGDNSSGGAGGAAGTAVSAPGNGVDGTEFGANKGSGGGGGGAFGVSAGSVAGTGGGYGGGGGGGATGGTPGAGSEGIIVITYYA